MEVLDADSEPLRSSSGDVQVRDNVQFVPFRSVQHNAGRLAREVLRELPEQITTYFHEIAKIAPGAPQVVPQLQQTTKPLDFAQPDTAFYGLCDGWPAAPMVPSAPPQ